MKIGTFKIGGTYKLELVDRDIPNIGSVLEADKNWVLLKDFRAAEEVCVQIAHIIAYVYLGD